MTMTERQYTGLQKVYTKGTLSGMIKINIRSSFPDLMQVCNARRLKIFKVLSL